MSRKRHLWYWDAMNRTWACRGGLSGKAWLWGRERADNYCHGCDAVITIELYSNVVSGKTGPSHRRPYDDFGVSGFELLDRIQWVAEMECKEEEDDRMGIHGTV